MESIWVGIRPEREWTRILVMSGAAETLLKARLLPLPSNRRALSTLLEAIALWQGRPVRAALVADAPGGLSESGLCRDSFPDFGDGLHYTLEYVSVLPAGTLPGADSVIPTSVDVAPPPPPETTLYVTVSVDGFPAVSVDVTVNVWFCPES